MIEITDFAQNTDDWYAEKAGKPSASNASKIVLVNGSPSNQRTKYLYTLAAERVSGLFTHGYYGPAMQRGHELEQEAADMYAFMRNVDVRRNAAVCYRDHSRLYLCSPDGFIDPDGGLEIKTAEGHIQVDRLANGWPLSEHFQQVQMTLYVTGRKWWDLMSYSPGLKPIVMRYEPDPAFFTALEGELYRFIADLNGIVASIQ